MEKLLLILGALLVALVIVVKVTERFGKPLEPEQQQKLSRWIVLLVGVAIVARLLHYYLTD